ncbi:hypothetical protein J6590_085312 [Homalodisca vitripennis]|nr:hypothetical protein J6590_085312 [Homalodisca vitripennis]
MAISVAVTTVQSQHKQIKQSRAWPVLGWVTAERSCPCKQSDCRVIGGGLEVTFKPLVPSSEGLTSTPVSKGITTMEDLKEHETGTKHKVTPRSFLEILYDMLVQTEPAYVPCKWYDAWYGLTGDNGVWDIYISQEVSQFAVSAVLLTTRTNRLAVKEKMFSISFLLITLSTEQMLPEKDNSVKMLSQMFPSRTQIPDLRELGSTTKGGSECSTSFLILRPGCCLYLLSCLV